MTRQITINAPAEIVKPVTIGAQTAGGLSAESYDTVVFWVTRGVRVKDLDENRSEIVLAESYLPLAGVDAWCSLGSSIANYYAWHELDDPSKVCPHSDSGETWLEWEISGNSGIPQEIDGKWYRSTQAFASNQGKPIDAALWYTYIATPDTANTGIIRMLSEDEYRALQPTPEV